MIESAPKKRLMIVDDEESLPEVVRYLLQGLALEIESFTHADEALNAALARDFDLILTDFTMPEMTGEDMIVRIQESKPARKPQVIFMTGSVTVPVTKLPPESYRLLSKPFDKKDLFEILKGWVPGL